MFLAAATITTRKRTIFIAQQQHELFGALRYVVVLQHGLFDLLRPESLLLATPSGQFHHTLRIVERNHVKAGRFTGQMLDQHQILALHNMA